MLKNILFGVLMLCFLQLKGQDFRESFFEGDWVKDVGSKPLSFKPDTFNIMDYGADNFGILKSTEAIQNTIDACANSGGGVVLIPDGQYLTGSIFLKNNINLIITKNASLLGSMELSDYEYQKTRMNGIEMVWPLAVINIIDAGNVKISGKGTINGQGKPFWKKFWNMEKIYREKNMRWAVMQACERPRMLLTDNAKNVIISEVTFREAAFWTVHILYSKHITIDGIIIRNNEPGEVGPSTDGIDLDSSEKILIQNCDIDCNDDNYCLKAGRDADGLRVNRPTRYIVIRDNIARAGGGVITFGSETSGGISHVYVHDIYADGNQNGIRFKSARIRGGYIKNILVEDVKLKNIGKIISATMNFNPNTSYPKLPGHYNYNSIPDYWKILLQKVEPPEKGICHVENIFLKNITATGHTAFSVEGFTNYPLKNFRFENVEIETEFAGKIKNAKNWISHNSHFSYEDKQQPVLINTSGMEKFYP
jgi:polygalacturonase